MSDAQAVRVEVGDCLELLERLEADSVDAVVTDPPYGLEFMGEDWDKPWAVGMRTYGHADGSARVPGPQHGSSRNPVCRTCRKHRRGSNRCACEVPDFDEVPADAMRAFQAWCEQWARGVLRVLKPGGHLLAFGGTRTYHRLASGVEDAGFEIRDRTLTLNGAVLGAELDWCYGSGWPKSRDISKFIDKRAGAEREVVGSKLGQPGYSLAQSQGATVYGDGFGGNGDPEAEVAITAPATPDAERWQGWGTALKPAHEPILVARKPFRGPVEGQVLATGTGAMNIDACRIDTAGEEVTAGLSDPANRRGIVGTEMQAPGDAAKNQAAQLASIERANRLGRWPANLVLLHAAECERIGSRRVPTGVTVRRNLDPEGPKPGTVFGGIRNHPGGIDVTYGDGDGLETIEAWACAPHCPIAQLDGQSGELRSGDPTAHGRAEDRSRNAYNADSRPAGTPLVGYGDQGGASRFFYQAKASPAEREAGLEDLPLDVGGGHLAQRDGKRMGRDAEEGANARPRPLVANTHPTVKPIELMRWLVRLVTPPGGTVLDPFAGSGSTGCAAALEGVHFLGFERDQRFAAIARARIDYWRKYPPGTRVDDVLEVETARRRGRAEAEEQRRALASAGQLDLLASSEG